MPSTAGVDEYISTFRYVRQMAAIVAEIVPKAVTRAGTLPSKEIPLMQ